MIKIKKSSKSLALQFFCVFGGIISVAPILYAAIVSLMSPSDIYTTELVFIPSELYSGNYEKVFQRINILVYIRNSFIVSSICSVSRVVFGSMAAYAFEFYEFKGKKFALGIIISSTLIPQEIIFTQNYITVSSFGLVNSYAGICTVYLINAMSILIIYQAFSSFSKSIRDAALLDGCGSVNFFLKILIPTNLTTLIAVFFTSFVSLWNIYLWPLVITNSNEMRTMQVAITMLKGRDSPDFGPVMAATTISLLPAITLFIIARRISNNRHLDYDE